MTFKFYPKSHISIVILCVLFLLGNRAAAQFSAGNLVVEEVGSGTTSAATPITLVEYTTAGVLTGASYALPSTGTTKITTSGSATSEGMISLSANRDVVLVPGYDATGGLASVASTASSANNREIFSVDATGAYTKVAYSSTAYTANNIRSATANGTTYYSAGTASGTVNSGIQNMGAGSSFEMGTTVTNARVVAIFNGQLYFSTGSGTTGIYTVGSGIPVTAGQTETVITSGGGTSPYAFTISPDGNTMYVADDAAGIEKFTKSGGVFVWQYTFASSLSRGITADFSSTPYVIYATSESGSSLGTYITKTIDNGAGSTPTTLATVPINYSFRGIVFSPVACPNITASTTASVSCNAGANGAVNVSVSGGQSPFTYLWNGPSGSVGTTASVSALAAGTYTVNVTAASGCTVTATAVISQPTALSVTPSQTNVLCNGGATGSATVAVTGGTPSYTYSWAPSGGTGATASGLAAGTYTCTVTDAHLCTATQVFTVTQPAALTASIAGTNVLCNGGATGSATVTPTGGTTPYSYSWAPSGGSAATATALAAGTYTCTITDGNSCQINKTIVITQPTTLSATASQLNVACFGSSSGSATVTPTGGTTPYSYSWAPSGGTGATATGLAAGTYTCTVTDANLCTFNKVITITQPASGITVTPSQTNVNCFGNATGSASVAVTGGTPAYTYLWAPGGATTAGISGVTAGTYTVTVTDANNCISQQLFTISQPTVLDATISGTNILCNGNSTGSATVTPTGGTTPYTYSWAPSGGTGATATNLTAGTYSCTVTDAHSCVTTQTVTITQPAALTASIAGSNVLCNSGITGSATVTPTGGTTPYTYSWAPSGGSGAIASSLAAGTYTCTITDANGCGLQKTITITQPPVLNASTTQTNVACYGSASGSATVTTTGGTPSYTYSWAPSGGTSATASGLAAGTYTVTITDANACVIIKLVTITQPAAALSATQGQTNVACYGNATASASVTVSGGTPAYTYAWAPSGGTGAVASGLAAGTYTCTVTDANGCSLTKNFTITQPAAALSATQSQANIACYGNATGSATVVVNGGTAPYIYSWLPSGGTAATASGLSAGTYTCTVTDNKGCSITKNFTITQPVSGLSATTSQTNISCNGGNNGSATVTVSGGTTPYTYVWSPTGGTNATANGLAAGTYTCTVTDANGCSITRVFTITQPNALAISITHVDVLCHGGNTGSATATVTGGTSPYTYNWQPAGGTNATANNLTAGTYTVTVTDANSCVITGTVSVTEPALMTASISGNATICNGNNTVINFTGTPNTTITYNVNGNPQTINIGGSGLAQLTVNPTVTTTYSLVSIQNNATLCAENETGSVTVTVNPTPVATITAGGSTTFCQGDSVILTANAGAGLHYQWQNGSNIYGATNQNYTAMLSGTYTVVDTNSYGCYSVSSPVIVTVKPLPATPTAGSNSPVCSGNTLSLTANSVTAGVTYIWNGPGGYNTNAQNPYINNAQVANSGVYTVSVTLNGCSSASAALVTAIVNQTPNAPSATDLSYCQYESATPLTAVGQSLIWYTTPTGGTGTAVAPTPATNVPGTYNFYVSQTINGCEGPRAQIRVLVKPQPAAPTTTAPVYNYCQYDNAIALVATGDSLQWYAVPNGGTGSFTAPIPSTSTPGTFTYYVTQTINACESNRLPIIVNVTAKPQPPVTQNVTYCQNQHAGALTAQGQNLQWYTQQTGGSGTASAPVPVTALPDTVVYYVSQTVNGCESDRAPLTVVVLYSPIAGITITDSSVCQYQTITFSYDSMKVPSETYMWTIPANSKLIGGALNSTGPIVLEFDAPGTQAISLSVSVGNQCNSSASTSVLVKQAPDGTLSMQNDICPLQNVWLAFNNVSPDVTGYTWNFNDANVVKGANNTKGPFELNWATPGNHSVEVVLNNENCPSRPIYDTVFVHYPPVAQIVNASKTNICAGDSVHFVAHYDAGNQYMWEPSQFFKNEANSTDVYGVIAFTGQVSLVVTSPFGCKDSATQGIITQPCCQVTFPDGFTPNGDGRNDIFRPITNGHHIIHEFYIMNRWGQVVYDSRVERAGWDGTFNGVPQDMGTYTYYIKYDCENGGTLQQKGDFVLIR